MSITGIVQSILRFFADLTGSPAWAIIIVTVLLKVMLHPLTVKQIRVMEQMKEIAPKQKALEEKYKGQPQEYQQRVAELYRDNKINPMAGCLPMLIPLPVLIVLFRVLQDKAFVGGLKGGALGFLWMKDLATPDPWILPILSGVTTWMSMRQTATDPSQKATTIIMPVMLGWFTMKMPAGAAIYWVVTNIVSIAQQWIIQRQLVASKKGVS
ncbi:MAG: YidC/Oxa1 family membrane protein insertase [Clostridia bacterium]|nr:YidC/Oxa1 family membrane protein insertase [Clostridia bacterium]